MALSLGSGRNRNAGPPGVLLQPQVRSLAAQVQPHCYYQLCNLSLIAITSSEKGVDGIPRIGLL